MFLCCITNHIRCKTYHILQWSMSLVQNARSSPLYIHMSIFPVWPSSPLSHHCVMKFLWGSFCIPSLAFFTPVSSFCEEILMGSFYVPSLAFFTPVSSFCDEILMGQFLHSQPGLLHPCLIIVWWNSYGAVSAFSVTSLSILATISGNMYVNFNDNLIIHDIKTVLQRFGRLNDFLNF